MSGPLDGLLVADFSRLLAGPHATMLLGDMGADVIKVEHPDGDDARHWGPPWVGKRDERTSAYYVASNRNKRSLALDLRSDDGRAAAVDLARRADIMVQNFRPGGAEKLGLGYPDMSAANPGLVYCSISGFGAAAGPDAIGNDFLLQAVGGVLSLTGDRDGSPAKVGFPVVDVLTGCYAAIGILAALAHRARTGAGQHVEVDLLSSLLASLINQSSNHLNAGVTATRMGTEHPSITPYGTLRAADRELAVAVTSERQFAALAAAVGRPELSADPRFGTNTDRLVHRDALRAALESGLAARSAADWIPRLRAVGVPAGLVNDVGEAFELARSMGLDAVVTQYTPAGGPVLSVADPVRLGATPVCYRRPPPAVGEHSEEILAWLGRR